MNKNFFYIIIIPILICFLSGCAIITHYEEYRFLDHRAVPIKSMQTSSKVFAAIPIHNSVYESKRISLFQDTLIYKEPYSYSFTIWGNFDEIEKLNAFFVQNKTKKINIPISADYLSKQRKESDDWSTHFYFPYDKEITLPIEWDKTETLEVEVNFIGKKNGVRRKYKLKNEYTKDAIIENTNLTWDGLMGI